MSVLREVLRGQRIASGIETVIGWGSMGLGAITGNRKLTAFGAGMATLGAVTNPDMYLWPYHRIRGYFGGFYYPRIPRFNRYIDLHFGRRHHHHHHHHFGMMSPHRHGR